ncbi:MAG: FCD domain-containing protein [Gordonia sp. (in: high G+C Gram-positive bacteria)]
MTAQPATARADPTGPPGGGSRAVQIARQIEADIIARGWPVGAALGSEIALQQQFGVSRAVLREAIRLIEHRQLARMRRGPGGGLFVTAPDGVSSLRALVIYLDYLGTTADDIIHARLLLEPLAAALTIDTLTKAGVEEITGTLARAGDDLPAALSNLHLAVARLSGNAVLDLFIRVLTRLTTRHARLSSGPLPDLERLRTLHRSIADAVIAGDTIRAQGALTDELALVSDWLAGRPRTPRQPVTEPPRPGDSDARLAELVAARIHDDIAAAGWPIGQVLGSETHLLGEYAIGRSVLREAVRILEYHSVARMRRGPGGGLVVTAPDPQTSIESMALFLEHRGVHADQLHTTRSAIELGIITRVCDLRSDAVIDRLTTATNWMLDGPDDEPRKADRFHTELADIAGNPVLSLFLDVITELFRLHSSRHTELPGDDAADEVFHAHERILDAIRCGDTGIARRRMRRHLDALIPWYDADDA